MTATRTPDDVGASSGLPPLPPDPETVSHDERARLTAALLAVADGADPGLRAEATRRVVLLNMRVARAAARRYRGRGVPTEDLEQVAYVALVRVAQRFDAGQGRDFLAFAVPSITGELQRHFRDHGWIIRPPRQVQRAHGRLARERGDLDRCSTASVRELAERTGEDEEVVAEALRLRALMRPVSLDDPGVARGPARGAPEISDDRLDFAAGSEARLALAEATRDLNTRERKLLRWRFVEELSQREIAVRLGTSQVSVSRLLARVLERLRQRLGSAA